MQKKLISFFTQKGYYLALLYWWIFRPKRRGVRVIALHGTDVLMVRPSYLKNALWTFPGGGIKKRETLEQAAVREVKEETDVLVENVQYLAPFVSTKEYKVDQISIVSAEAATKAAPRPHDILEIAEAGWFSLDALPPMGPIAKNILATYFQHKK